MKLAVPYFFLIFNTVFSFQHYTYMFRYYLEVVSLLTLCTYIAEKRPQRPNVPKSLNTNAGTAVPLGPRPVPRRLAPPRPMDKPGDTRVRSSGLQVHVVSTDMMQFSPGSPTRGPGELFNLYLYDISLPSLSSLHILPCPIALI